MKTNDRVKYPRTLHLPSSPGVSSDDKVHRDFSVFEGMDVVVTEKMDGENTTMYPDYVHARSLTYTPHESRAWIKRIQAEVGHHIPTGWRVCGENVFARHSIPYETLEGYFYVFSVWDDNNRCLSWDDTVEWAALLGLPTVPVLHRGKVDQTVIEGLVSGLDLERQEGFVVRPSAGFSYQEFSTKVGKWVRKGHVQTDTHWMHQAVIPNGLKD